MKFRLVHQQIPNSAQSPVRVVEQTSGRGVSWINRYLPDFHTLVGHYKLVRHPDLMKTL